jgi:hypothetical protein
MQGANPAGLEALVRKYAPAGGASGLGSSSTAAEKGLEGFVSQASLENTDKHRELTGDRRLPRSQTSLNSMIDAQQVVCLNESVEHTIRDLLKGGGDKWLESDADEQLLIHIPVRGGPLTLVLATHHLPKHRPTKPSAFALSVSPLSPPPSLARPRQSVYSSMAVQPLGSTTPSLSSRHKRLFSRRRRQRGKKPFNSVLFVSRTSVPCR